MLVFGQVVAVFCRKKFEMQKLKIEEDFAEKALLVQIELEEEREKAKSEKEKYENEKAKLEQERKKLEQLQIEIQERGERITTPVNLNKHSSNSDISLNNDKSINIGRSNSKKDLNSGLVTDKMATTVLSVSGNSEQASSGLHESIHGSQQTSTLTSAEMVEREKQLLLQKEKLEAMQAQLNGKLSGNLDGDNSEILQFVAEKEKIEQQRILLERAKFSAESKER